jgi:hypothetical protein
MSSSQATHPATASSTALRATRAGLIDRHPDTSSCRAVDRERDCRALVVRSVVERAAVARSVVERAAVARSVVERAAERGAADRGGAVFRVAISLHQLTARYASSTTGRIIGRRRVSS